MSDEATMDEKIEKLAKWLDVQFDGPQIGNQVRAVGAEVTRLRTENERWQKACMGEANERDQFAAEITRAEYERDAARVEVSQLRAKIERVEAHDEWATREREHFRNQMFVERDRTERVEARIGAALAWLDDADPLPERNGDIFADLRAALAEPLGSTEDPPATDERRSE